MALLNEDLLFYFGMSYCPYAKSKDLSMLEWEADIEKMKDLGFTAFRSFVAWDRIETNENEYNFEKLDHIFEIAEKHKMKVFLNLGGVFDCYGGIYAPRWLINNYECQRIMADPYVEQKTYGALQRLCLDDPIFKKKAEEFTVKVIERYASKDSLAVWVVWNEPVVRDVCYCSHTLNEFRQWLQKKYDELSILNEKWGSEFPIEYKTWNEIEPPTGSGFFSGGNVARLDWLKFTEDQLANKINHVHQLVKKYDPKNRDTTINTVSVSANDSSEHTGTDIWKLAKAVDVAGYSHYTAWIEAGWERAMKMDRIANTSLDSKKKFYILETEAGPCGRTNTRSYEWPKRGNTYWQGVARGAISILAWKFRGRVSDSQTDDFNLMAWDGSLTERAEQNSIFAKKIEEIYPLIHKSSRNAEVAILVSSELMIFSQVNNTKEVWKASWQGAYRALWDLNIPVEFIDDSHITGNQLQKYKLLILPNCANLDNPISQKLEKFVTEGGNIIADFFTGIKDNDGNINLLSPGFGLDKVFGCYFNDKLEADEHTLMNFSENYNNAQINAFKNYHYLFPYPGTAVLATFSNNKIAATSKKLGKGKAIFLGSLIFAGYRDSEEENYRIFMRNLLKSVNIESHISVIDCNGVVNNIEISMLENDDQPLFIIISHHENNIDVSLLFQHKIAFTGELKFKELINDTIIIGKDGKIPLQLGPFETKIISSLH